MKPLHLRIFNDVGMQEFRRRWEVSAQSGSELQVSDMIENDQLTEVVSQDPIVNFTEFGSRRECGEFFYSLLNGGTHVLTKTDLHPSSSVELWAWLSAVWCPWLQKGVKSKKNGNLGESARWLFEPNNSLRYYRHMLAGPYLIVAANSDNPDRAQILLYNEVVSPNTRWVEAICGSEGFHFNKTLLDALSKNLIDKRTGEPSPATAALKRRKAYFAKRGKHESGTIDRFTKVYNQLSRTWDLNVADAKRLAELFGPEFRPFFGTK